MARTSKAQLLDHLFTQLKSKATNTSLNTDLDRAEFVAGCRMPVQARAAKDPSRHKSIRCPRRAGKSWFVLSLAIEACLRKANSIWVIAGLARPSVRSIFWELLRKLNEDLELGMRFHEVELTAHFSNGSQIKFRGAETRAEIEKLRGSQYDGVIVDECKSFHPLVLTELVQDVIEPALADRKGTIILIGTPGDIFAGPFYEATCEPPIFTGEGDRRRASNKPYGSTDVTISLWSFHTWTLQDNIEMPHLWTEALEIKNARGWADDHPTWRREYLGHWVAGNSRLVYRYIPSIHNYEGELPGQHEWRTVLALDMGFTDADAIVVWAYSPTSYDVYVIYAEKRPHLNITQLSKWITQVRDAYCDGQPEVMTGDFGGLATKVFEELAALHNLPFEPAEKREKNDFIEIMNNEYDAGRIHIIGSPEPDSLQSELLSNRWLEKSLGTAKKVEDPKTPNDLCDAHLYGWRWCDHRRAQPLDRQIPLYSTEWWLEKQKREFEAAVAQHLASKKEDDDRRLDADWWGQDSTYSYTIGI